MQVSPGTYQHWKGGYYVVDGMATHTETGEQLVVYRSVNSCDELEPKFFVRPVDNFVENVEVDGVQVPRFSFQSSETADYGNMEALEQCLTGHLPNWVKGLRFETGEDVIGDPAIWIWVATDISLFSKGRNKSREEIKQVQELVKSCLRKNGISYWHYLRFQVVD